MKRISLRILSLCLAAVLLIGVCPMVMAQEEAVTPTSVKRWVTSDLVATAIDGAAVGETQAIGYFSDAVWGAGAACIMIAYNDVEGNMLIKEGDTIRFTAKINAPQAALDNNGSSKAGLARISTSLDETSATDGRDMTSLQFTYFDLKALPEKTDSIYGYTYRDLVLEHTLTASDISAIKSRGFFTVWINNRAISNWIYVYDYTVTNETTGVQLLQVDGFQHYTHYTADGTLTKDYKSRGDFVEGTTDYSKGSTAKHHWMYYNADPTAKTNLVSYTDAWEYRKTSETEDTYNTVNTAATAHTANADGKVAAKGSAGKLAAGDYTFEFDLSTQLVADSNLPLATLRAVDSTGKVLASDDFTLAESNAIKNFLGIGSSDRAVNQANNYGEVYRTLALDFQVSAETEVFFEVVLYNNTDFRMRRVELFDVTAPAQKNAPAVVAAINAIGEVTEANYTDAKAKIETAEKALADYVTAYGQDNANLYVTNQATLTAARAAYDGFAAAAAAKQAAAKDVMDKINAIGEVTADNYTQKLAAITAAEAARQSYIDTYGEGASDDITNYDTLHAARTAYDTFLQADQKKQADADAVKQKINDIGEVTAENYTDKEAAITAAETALADFEKVYGTDALAMITNSADLTAARTTYNDAKAAAEKQAAAAAVNQAVTAIGEITEDNRDEKLELLTAAEALYAEYAETYGEEEAAALEQAAALTAARQAYDNTDPQLVAAKAFNDAVLAMGEVTDENKEEKRELYDAAAALYDEYAEKYGEEAAAELEQLETYMTIGAFYESMYAVVYGDINADDKIDAADALQALQHSVELIELTGEKFDAANVDGNEEVDAADALLILQYAVELIEIFPVESATME